MTISNNKIINVLIKARNNGKRNYKHDGDVVSVKISDGDYEYLKSTTGKYDIETINKCGNILNIGLEKAGVDTNVYCAEATFKSEFIK